MRTVILTIGKELTLTGSLGAVGVGAAASFTLTARGGSSPYRISVDSAELPAGWSMVETTPKQVWTITDSNGGEWVVTSTGDGTVDVDTTEAKAAGEFSITFLLRDSARHPVLITRSISVVALPLELAGTLPTMTVGTPYSAPLTITGGIAPYAITGEFLPAGLSAAILGGTLTVSGTPTGAGLGQGTSFSVLVSLFIEDSTPVTPQAVGNQQNVTINVPAVVTTIDSLPDATIGVTYVGDSSATGGTGGYVFTLDAAPGWMTINSSTGALGGMPTGGSATGVTVTVRATDSEGNFDTATDTMDVIVLVPWTPAQLGADLYAWHISDDPSNVLSGSTVVQITDKSGNGHHLIVNGGNTAPTVGVGINSRTTVFAASASPEMALDVTGPTANGSRDFLQNRAGVSVAQVYDINPPDVSTAVNRCLFAVETSAFGFLGFGLFAGASTANTPLVGGRATATGSGVFLQAGAAKTGPTVLVAVGDYQGNSLLISSDGTTASSAFHGGGINSENNLSALNGGVSLNFPGGASPYLGGWGEQVLTTSALSPTNREKLEGYLAWDWGTVAALPSGHPYKSARPYV